jgi:hypothetical protein
MSTAAKDKTRSGWPGRMEWSALLATALLLFALPSASPAAWGASGTPWVAAWTASAAPANYDAVLWWLQTSTTNGEPALTSSAATSTFSPTEIEALLLKLEGAVTSQATTASNIDSRECATEYNLPTTIADDSSAMSLDLSLASIPRYDATRRLTRYSLSAHEAGFRAGTRANRYLE